MRRFLTWAVVAFGLGLALPASAQQAAPAAPKAEANKDAPVATDALHSPGPIHENVLGKADAPVTIVEYASLTCPHCATFHLKTLPAVKTEFIDTGKARLIFRDFPFDGVAMAATMLARCAAPEKFFPIMDVLFQRQADWAFVKDPEAALIAIGKEQGFSQEKFDACLQNQAVYDGVLAVRQKAYEVFKVDSTPTVFINGEPYRGVLTAEQMAIHINRHLAGK